MLWREPRRTPGRHTGPGRAAALPAVPSRARESPGSRQGHGKRAPQVGPPAAPSPRLSRRPQHVLNLVQALADRGRQVRTGIAFGEVSFHSLRLLSGKAPHHEGSHVDVGEIAVRELHGARRSQPAYGSRQLTHPGELTTAQRTLSHVTEQLVRLRTGRDHLRASAPVAASTGTRPLGPPSLLTNARTPGGLSGCP